MWKHCPSGWCFFFFKRCSYFNYYYYFCSLN